MTTRPEYDLSSLQNHAVMIENTPKYIANLNPFVITNRLAFGKYHIRHFFETKTPWSIRKYRYGAIFDLGARVELDCDQTWCWFDSDRPGRKLAILCASEWMWSWNDWVEWATEAGALSASEFKYCEAPGLFLVERSDNSLPIHPLAKQYIKA